MKQTTMMTSCVTPEENKTDGILISSISISERTGKQHPHVMRDIRKTLEELEIDVSRFGGIYKDSYNRDKPMFLLPEREAMILASGYSIKLRAAIIDELRRLESLQKPSLPTNYLSALKQLVVVEEQKEQLVVENKTQADIIVKQEEEIHKVKVQYARYGEVYNTMMASDNLYKATNVGMRFGVSGILFNKIMKDAGVIRKVAGVWGLTSKYIRDLNPYAVLREERKANSAKEETVMTFAWTSIGVNWVVDNWELALDRMSETTRASYDKATSNKEPTIPKKRKNKKAA